MIQLTRNLTDSSLNEKVESFIQQWGKSELVEVQTSGSTGSPKTIAIQKKHMITSARATLKRFNIQNRSTALLCLSVDTIAGKMMVIRSIIGSLQLHIGNVDRRPLEEIDESIEFVAMVPLQLNESIKHDIDKLKRIRTILIGGGPISPSLEQEINRHQLRVYHSFGMTETISHVAIRELFGNQKEYRALSHSTFSQKDGKLIIDAPELGVHHLETNDQVELLGDKSFIWLGRADNVINSGGIKIHPEQIESQLSQIIPLPFFTCGISDEKYGERVVLCISGKLKLSKELIGQRLHGRLIPKEIYYFEEFEYTESGKINRPETIKNIKNAEIKVL